MFRTTSLDKGCDGHLQVLTFHVFGKRIELRPRLIGFDCFSCSTDLARLSAALGRGGLRRHQRASFATRSRLEARHRAL